MAKISRMCGRGLLAAQFIPYAQLIFGTATGRLFIIQVNHCAILKMRVGPMKKALLVGINKYTTQKRLRGCVRDVIDMADVLERVFRFDDLQFMTNGRVTKAGLQSALTSLLAPEDGETDGVRVFFFAGHGGRVFDTAGGDELDRIDENLCLPDYLSTDPGTYLLDDDIGTILQEAHANAEFLRTYVLFDACHSGTGTRDVVFDKSWQQVEQELFQAFGERDPLKRGFLLNSNFEFNTDEITLAAVARQASDPEGLEDLLDNADADELTIDAIGHGANAGEPTSHLLLSGCHANQTCKEVPIDGGYHGIFTKVFTELARSQPDFTWQDIRNSVNEIIGEQFNQAPQLEGPDDFKNRAVFT